MRNRLWLLVTFSFLCGIALAACSPMPAAPGLLLEGTPWTLESYLNSQGDLVGVLPDTEITVSLEAGEVRGSAGCNSYFGMYEIDADQVAVGPVGSTMMECPHPEGIMEQESQYLAALGSAASYQIEGDRLEIANADGETVLIFNVAEPTSLTGTTWLMTFYYNGRDALVSAILGTEITAVFGDDGRLAGSAGCNNYTTGYKLDGDKITIDPAASTKMACSEPEGIMEQEYAYLAALTTATKYEIEGEELRLLDAEGRKASVYTAKPEATTFALEALQNAEYQTEWTPEGTVRLADGEYRAPAAPGSASEIVITLSEYVAVSELGGQPAAAVILYSSGGGSGTFRELHVMVERDGQPYDVAWTQLGDRVQINSLSIQNGEIVVDMVTHGPDDPMCCPTQQVVQTYKLQGSELVQG